MDDIEIQELSMYREFTNTPNRRHNFYCYCSHLYCQEMAIFFMLVEDFRRDRRKRQAVFLTEWFVKGNIPKDLKDEGFLTEINISSKQVKEYGARAEGAVNAVGRTFIDKAKNHGGGVKGLLGALKQKKSGNTQISGEIFDDMQIYVIGMLNENRAADFKLDHDYMPNGKYAGKIAKLRMALKDAGFDPNGLGIY